MAAISAKEVEVGTSIPPIWLRPVLKSELGGLKFGRHAFLSLLRFAPAGTQFFGLFYIVRNPVRKLVGRILRLRPIMKGSG